MSRYHDKLIEELTAPEPRPRRTEPRTLQEVRSFVRGFDLSLAAVRRITEAWTEDIDLARSEGYDNGYQEGRWDE